MARGVGTGTGGRCTGCSPGAPRKLILVLDCSGALIVAQMAGILTALGGGHMSSAIMTGGASFACALTLFLAVSAFVVGNDR